MKESCYPINSAETQTSITKGRDLQLRWLEIAFWLLAIVLGFAHAWADHHYLTNADAMSYLDVAEAYLRKDWDTAVNAYWSPLYSWLIALALFIVRPSPYWKFAVVHIVNFAMYLFALGCFGFLIRELVRFQRTASGGPLAGGLGTLPDWALLAIGYSLFIWTSLFLINIPVESPDMLVAAFVYLASGLLLRIRRQPSSWMSFVLLGVGLGFGYLAKSVMLPLAVVYLAASILSIGSLRRALPRVSLAVALFLVIAGPFVFAISKAKGRLTFGDTGRLNYLWSINRIPHRNWQGEQPGFGMLRHPTRKIFDTPPVYEFGYPVGGTYPLWYDPTYWYEGSAGKFDFQQQLRVLGRSVQSYYELLHKWGLQYGLLVGLLILYLMRRPKLWLYDLAAHWSLIVPAMAGMALYSMVVVHGRYVAPFLTILWLGLFSAVRLPHPEFQKLIKTIAIVLTAVFLFSVVASSSNEAVQTVRSLVAGQDPSTHEQWQVAEGLRTLGVTPGDEVGVIGDPLNSFWAHLAGVRIIAELQAADANTFWEGDSTLRAQIIQTFAGTGAKAIVVEKPASGINLSGWQKIGSTDYYTYLLKN